ncbi:uncharacterized protein LOC108601347 [Drosophila busckii]|uniref:uncharacterized protein LOC108601347 n=1 Tax=Drosophila busckii TaxID=30019 RepID=UPI00083F38FF|nr:uncharacterized protein LOC108601347 [Drosophila busckii]
MASKKIRWTPDSISMLIDAYEQHPNLYDSTSDLYHKKRCRTASLNAILKIMRQVYDDINVTEIKRKIATLRSQYLLHLKKEASNSRSSMGYEERGRISWINNLEFLQPFLKTIDINASNRSALADSDSQDIYDEEIQIKTSNSSIASVEEPDPSVENIVYRTVNERQGSIRNKRKFDHNVDPFVEIEKDMGRIDEIAPSAESTMYTRSSERLGSIRNKRKFHHDIDPFGELEKDMVRTDSAPPAESMHKTAKLTINQQTIGNKPKFDHDVDSFGELVKAEMARIDDPKLRMEVRIEILQLLYKYYN